MIKQNNRHQSTSKKRSENCKELSKWHTHRRIFWTENNWNYQRSGTAFNPILFFYTHPSSTKRYLQPFNPLNKFELLFYEFCNHRAGYRVTVFFSPMDQDKRTTNAIIPSSLPWGFFSRGRGALAMSSACLLHLHLSKSCGTEWDRTLYSGTA